MSTKSGNDVVLVINTAQRQTYEMFNKNRDNLLSGDICLYDTAHIYSDKTNIKSLKPGVFSYLRILRRERPNNIVIIYDGNRSQFFYFNMALFILIAHILGKRVNYYSHKGTYADITKLFPLDRPFTPLFLLRSIPSIFKAYVHCFFSSKSQGRIMGFNKFFAPMNFWYETVGKKQLQYGCWGYSYIGNFGDSQRERFYNHYLSYGYLLNKMGFRCYHALAAALYLISFLIVFVASGNWIWGVILLPLILLSPYYTFSFLSYTKPENIAWFLALPVFYCAAESFIIPLAVLLLFSTYLSFTVFFFISTGVIALLCSQLNPVILLAFVPVGIRLLVDFYAVLKHGFVPQLLHIISGKGGDERSRSHRRYGIQHTPRRYVALFFIACILTVTQLLLHINSWPVSATFSILLFGNFQFVRIADAQSFYRFFLSILLFSLLSTTNIFVLIAGSFVLLVNPRWVDDLNLIMEHDTPKTYPPLERIIWTKEQDISLEGFISGIKPGCRVLFEYTGHIALSPFRNILSVLEAKLFDKNVELLPHEMTFYTNPRFSYDWSCHLSPKGDLDSIYPLMKSCSISYLIVFSEDLLNSLLEKGYQLVSEFNLNNLRGFINDASIPTTSIYLLYCSNDLNFCSDQSVTLECYPNQMILKRVKEGSEYIIHYTYHKDWRAYQDSRRVPIRPIEVYGLNFIQLKARNSCDILLKFGNLNHIVR